jgi:hypothetical protein
MSNEKDVATAPQIVEGSPFPDKKELPLTPEQRVFAEVLGREIAQRWAEAQRGETDCNPT